MKKLCLFLLSVFAIGSVFCVTKGSDSIPSIEPLALFPASDTDNVMLGFGWFKNGFTLEDSATTVTFNSVYPVSSQVSLHGGLLYLTSDLIFSNNAALDTLGTFQANNHSIDFSATITGFPAALTTIFHDANIFLNSDFTIGGTLKIHGNCLIDGRNNRIILDGNIIIDPHSTLKLRNLELSGMQQGKIYCTDESGSLHLDSMRMVLSDDYTFSQGSIKVFNNVDLVGHHTFAYTSGQTSTIDSDSMLRIAECLTFRIGRKNGIYAPDPLYFTDQSSTLRMETSTINITDSGLALTRGTFIGDGEVKFTIDSTSTANGFSMGDGNPDHDFRFRLYPSAAFRLADGHFVYDIVQQKNFLADDIEAKFIHQGSNATFYAKQDINFENVTIKFDDASVVQISEGRNLILKNTIIHLDVTDYTITATRYGDYASLLAGDGSISIDRGQFPLLTLVTGNNNELSGAGDCTGPIYFLDSAATLSFGIEGTMSGGITLNGGTLILTSKLNATDSLFPSTQGTINAQHYAIEFPYEDFVWTSSLVFEASNGILDIKSRISLSSEIIFNGKWTILGNGNELDFVNSGSIIIGPHSTVSFKNIALRNLKEESLHCSDDSGKLIFDNAQILMSDDFRFSAGSFNIKSNFDVLGSYTFLYESSVTSTIQANSCLHINPGTTFMIGKAGSSAPDSLYCVDQTSKILLENAYLTVVNYGFKFTRGTLIFDKEVSIDILPTSTTAGLVFGDGNADNDPIASWNAGSVLNAVRGYLTYNVTNPEAFVAKTSNTMIEIGPSFNMNIEQNMVIQNIAVQTNTLWELIISPGKTLSYKNYTVQFPGTQYNITGQYYSDAVNLLAGNNGILVTTGVLPLANYIMGSGNYMRGLGGVSGPIILADSNADLTLGLLGRVSTDITLQGGTVYLENPLLFGENNTIVGLGNVDLGTHEMSLTGADLVWTGTVNFEGSGASLRLNGNMKLTSQLAFDGNVTLYGNGHSIDFAGNGNILVGKNSLMFFRDVDLRGLSGKEIHCFDDSSGLIFDNCTFLMDGDFCFTVGSFSIQNNVDVMGTHTFFYQSSMTSTVQPNASLHIASDSQLSIGKSQTLGNEPLYFENGTSALIIDNATLVVTSSGMQLTRGHFILENEVEVDIGSTSTMNGLIIGDGTDAGNMLVDWNAGSEVGLVRGHLTYNNNDPTLFRSRTQNTKAILSAGFVVNLAENLEVKNLTAIPDPASQIWVDPGVVLSYKDYQVDFPGVSFQINGKRYDDFVNLLTSNDHIIINTGALPLATIVAGPGNSIYGSGHIGGPIYLQGPYAQLSIGIAGQIFAPITLGGNTLTVGAVLALSNGITIEGLGTVELSDKFVVLTGRDYTWTSTLVWDSSGGAIFSLTANKQHLSSQWTFSGACTIDGQASELRFGSTGKLVVERGSSLTLKNIKLRGITQNSLSCLDGAGTIIFDNVDWQQDDSYNFSAGSFEVHNDLVVRGTTTFGYRSDQVSSIKSESALKVTENMVFSYAPPTASRTLLTFEGQSSKLLLDKATLHSTSTGCTLTKGTLQVDGYCNITSDASCQAEGIILGDGVSASNNASVDIFQNATLNIASGYLVYNNVT